MTDPTTSIISTIARYLAVPDSKVAAAVRLLDEGATVPFIARYRKEATGGLDDGQLRTLAERLSYLRDLEDRKSTILARIDEQEALTEELRAAIAACETKARLEDLYLPYKKKRRTKAAVAREAGLEPLLEKILGGADPDAVAEGYCCEGFADASAALGGARDILIDRLTTNSDLVGELRSTVWSQGSVVAEFAEGVDPSSEAARTYADYADHSEPIASMPGHRVLAVLRGEKNGALTVSINPGDDAEYERIIARHTGLPTHETVGGPRAGGAQGFLADAVHRGWRTRLSVSSSVDVRLRLREEAEKEAVSVFSTNVRDILLAAPAGQRPTLGLDPGYRTGVKVAVIGATGAVVHTGVVYPHQPAKKWEAAVATLADLCDRYDVELIAIGNGTASRETDQLAREVSRQVGKSGRTAPTPVVVSEAGASVYSASDTAAQEFPEMDVALRGAVSIARRLQDPLAELVKIDPKSLGVGQYQHDVDAAMLADTLDAVVEDAVNAVGVEVNTASAPLLRRVSGVTPSLAAAIVAHRDTQGAFASRRELLDVPRLGPKAFEQCAGFLRIRGGANPLDASAVHPESYGVVDRIADTAGCGVTDLVGQPQRVATLRPADFVDEEAGVGIPTVTDILAELEKPGRDPRPDFVTATFADGVHTLGDLQPGMVLEGTVTNVAAFGAFVDIGVHHDGLVHVSAMADRFVSDPHDVVRSGQVVRVKVMNVDTERKRIGLSLRLTDEPEGTSEDKQPQRTARRRRTDRVQRSDRSEASGSMANALRQAGFGR